MQQIYRRTSMPKYDFNKFALQLYWIYSSTRVLSCNFTVYFQNAFPKSTSGGLLLEQGISEKKRTLMKKNKFLHLSFEILNENERCLEAVVQTCSCKMVFLEISQNLRENTCARVSFLIKLQALNYIWPFRDVIHERFKVYVAIMKNQSNDFKFIDPVVPRYEWNILLK